MKLQLYGRTSKTIGFETNHIFEILRLTSGRSSTFEKCDVQVIKSKADFDHAIRKDINTAIVIGEFGELNHIKNVIYLPDTFSYLEAGDLISFQASNNSFRVLFRKNSNHNSFLVTERCNHYCLMCSQPPRTVNDSWILDEIQEAIPLINKNTGSLGFTGGEPLLDWRKFVDILLTCRDALPNTAIQVLTNGRAFSKNEVCDAWANIKHFDLIAAIPVYSAVDTIHDYVVQSRNAFHETLLGIQKLKERGQRVEIRVVLHAITAPIIEETCKWIGRNLPFVDHVALMGLENTGFAIANEKLLWIDPIDYKVALARAVEHLACSGVSVSIYNLPFCVLEKSTWDFAVQSISDWKNGFVDECNSCNRKANCSGFFTSGRQRLSRAIAPILD